MPNARRPLQRHERSRGHARVLARAPFFSSARMHARAHAPSLSPPSIPTRTRTPASRRPLPRPRPLSFLSSFLFPTLHASDRTAAATTLPQRTHRPRKNSFAASTQFAHSAAERGPGKGSRMEGSTDATRGRGTRFPLAENDDASIARPVRRAFAPGHRRSACLEKRKVRQHGRALSLSEPRRRNVAIGGKASAQTSR